MKRHISSFMHALKGSLWAVVVILATTSCGILDFNLGFEGEEGSGVYEKDLLSFSKDVYYVMEGDTFQLAALNQKGAPFPDAVFWTTHDDSVATVIDNVFYALSEGETTVTALSVTDLQRAQSTIAVLPLWKHPGRQPFETVIVADIDAGGRPFDPATMKVCAMLGGRCCALGELCETAGRRYTRFRVSSEMIPPEGDDDYFQDIRFAVYIPSEFAFDYFDQTVPYDGETHGSLSHPVLLTITNE